jgi:hypothetical protein
MGDGEASAQSALEAATRRLSAALEALAEAVERRCETDGDQDDLAGRVQALSSDRAVLADQLDGSMSRARMLEQVNRDVAQRLDTAIATVRAVVEAGETK